MLYRSARRVKRSEEQAIPLENILVPTALDIVAYHMVNIMRVHPPLRPDSEQRENDAIRREFVRV